MLLPVNTSFAVRIHCRKPPALAVDEVLGDVVTRLTGLGFVPEEEKSTKRVFVRSERPTWTIVVAVLLFPLGLLALAHRARSQVVVSASAAGHGMTAVDVSGTAPLAVRKAVRDRASPG